MKDTKEFIKTLKRFQINIENLRDFTAIIEPILTECEASLFKEKKRDLLPFALAFAKINDDDKETVRKLEGEFKKEYGEGSEIILIEENKVKTGARINLPKELQEKFSEAMDEVSRASLQTQQLYESALVSLISNVELLFSSLIHIYLDLWKNPFGGDEKKFSLNDLKSFETIQDAENYLKEQKVEALLRGSFLDWIDYLKTHAKLSMGYLEDELDDLFEACLRRNLIVHNGGILNNIYLNKVAEKYSKGKEVEERIKVSKKYLVSKISNFERNCSLIALELWKKLDQNDQYRGAFLMELIYELLKNGEWEFASSLCIFLKNDKKMDERALLCGIFNYWLCMKRLKEWNNVKEEFENFNPHSRSLDFQLAWYSLAEDFDRFFEFLPKALAAEAINEEDLCEWPIFEEVRLDMRYLENYKTEQESRTNSENGAADTSLISE